jgi:histidinol-phosphate aminotransferase
VLDSAIRAFAEPGDAIAYPEPSFAMIPLFARMNALEGIAVPLGPELDIDAGGLLATDARMLYICSPNNPTGTSASRRAIEAVVARTSGIVILDEAYAEFGGDTWVSEAPSHGRLLVVRTMSKAFGLAGLRIGYAVGDPTIVAEVEKSRGPYKVSRMGELAALAALGNDLDWVRARITDVREGRRRLRQELIALGLSPIPSDANFVLVPVPDALAIARQMRALGVAVRPFTGLAGIGDALRITIGPWSQIQAALDALRECLCG